MSNSFSRNTRRDMATSAICTVALRPWLTIFAPIVITFSRSVANRPLAAI